MARRLAAIKCSLLAPAIVLGFFLVLAGARAASAGFEIPNSEIHTISSQELSRTYQIFVKTPRGYSDPQNAATTYPVIYLNDGPYTFQVASGVTHLPMNFGQFEKAILVGISFADGENGMDSRVRDYTPSVDKDWRRETGGAAAYFDFMKSSILPFVETTYRADPDRRVLSGQSLGGLFGAYVLFTEPDVFSDYILTSPSLWFDDKHIFALEEDYAASHADLRARVYFATGAHEAKGQETRHDLVGDQTVLAERLRARGYPGLAVRDEIIPDSLHETTFPIGFTRAMLWMFRAKAE